MRGSPITQAHLSHSIDTGVRIEGIPYLVPEYHVMAAAAEASYKYYDAEWQDMPYQQKAKIVALHFARILVHNHSEDAQARAAHKESERANSKETK